MLKRAVWGLLTGLVLAKRFERVASSTTGWYVLDKACFGYAEGPDSHQGELNLRLVPRSSPPPQQMQILLYDDEPNSFPSVSDRTPCNARPRSAKNYADKELHTVRWVNNQWILPTITITNSYKPRMWYLVLNSCLNETFEVTYDSDLGNSGLYHRGQGPSSNNCEVDPGFEKYGPSSHYNDLVGASIAFFLISLILAVALAYQCRRTRILATAPVSVKANDEHEGGSKWNDEVAAADELEEEADV